MNILLLTNMYPSSAAPNYGVFVKRTEDTLQDAGYNVTRVSLTKKSSKVKKVFGYMIYVLKFLLYALSPRLDAIYVHYASQNAKLITFIKKIRPSLPIVLNVHGTDVLPQTVKQQSYQPAVEKLFQTISHTIVPSSYYEKVVREKYEYTGPVTVYPSGGVDTTFFTPDELIKQQMRKSLDIPTKATVIGYISRIDVQKGWDVLLDAINIIRLKDKEAFDGLEFIIAGTGAQEEDFKKKMKELELEQSIIKMPMLTQLEMQKTFNTMDAFCFPSFQESLGLVGIEAMACGLPIIASDIPGIKDYAKASENALLFKKGDADMLADAIISYHSIEGEQRRMLSNNALATAKSFDSEYVKKQLLTTFTDLNNKKRESNT